MSKDITREPDWEAVFDGDIPNPAEVAWEHDYWRALQLEADYADYLAHRAEEEAREALEREEAEAAQREAAELAEIEEAARLQAQRQERGRNEAPFYEFLIVPGQVGHYYVVSATGRIYKVGPDWCGCPDFEHTCMEKGIRCKHMVALAEWQARGHLAGHPAPDSERAQADLQQRADEKLARLERPVGIAATA